MFYCCSATTPCMHFTTTSTVEEPGFSIYLENVQKNGYTPSPFQYALPNISRGQNRTSHWQMVNPFNVGTRISHQVNLPLRQIQRMTSDYTGEKMSINHQYHTESDQLSHSTIANDKFSRYTCCLTAAAATHRAG